MEPVSLGVVVAALIAKAMDRVEDGALDGGWAIVRRTINVLRDRFAQDGDQEAGQALERLAEVPDSPKLAGALAELLEDRMSQEFDLRAELAAMVEVAKSGGVDTDAIVQTVIGHGNVQIAGVSDSDVSIGDSPGSGRRR